MRPSEMRTINRPTKSGLSFRDLLSEVNSAIVARPGRSILTALGTVLGVGTLVAILGLTSTATGQVSARFDAQAATTVVVTDERPADSSAPYPFTRGALDRAAKLNGVNGVAATYTPTTDDKIRSSNPSRPDEQSIPIFAASPDSWDALEPKFSAGRPFDRFHNNLPVVVLGKGAASLLGISGNGPPTAVDIGGRPFTVIGVLADAGRRPDLLLGVIVPSGIAQTLWGEPTAKEQAEVIIATKPGAAMQVTSEALQVMSYLNPASIRATPPPDPRALRDSVSSDLQGLFYALAGISLLIGTVGIANTTLVAVMERASEIGLRRALGAKGRHVAIQILAESAGLGVLGGVLGSSVGLTAVVGVSLERGWSPIIDPWYLLLAPAIGLLVGSLAGMYPAARAIRIEPTQALRGTSA